MKITRFSKKIGLLLLFGVLFLALATPAQAFTPRSDDTVIIEAGEVIDDDLYAVGNSVIVEGTITGDLVAAGSLIEIWPGGVVEGDLIAAGQGVVVNGVVQGDVRIAGMSLVVGEGAQIGEDLLAFGYSLDVQAGSRIGLDVVVGAGAASLGGEIGRNVNASVQGLEVGGSIGGDLTAKVGDPAASMGSPGMFMPQQTVRVPAPIVAPSGLTILPEATIAGRLAYTGVQPGEIPAGVVAGETTFTPRVVEAEAGAAAATPPSPLETIYAWMVDQLRKLAALLLVALPLAIFFPHVMHRGADTLQSQPLIAFLAGALAYVGFFFLLLILVGLVVSAAVMLGIVSLSSMVWTTLGIGALGFTGLTVSFHIAVSYVAQIIVAVLIGRRLVGQVRSDLRTNRFWPPVIGILLIVAVTSIPFVGWLVNLLIVLFGLGALVLMLRDAIVEARSPAPILQPQS